MSWSTGNFHMIGDDLVNSYHLLLCCLDLVYGNALLCANKKDLINPYFKGDPHRHTVVYHQWKICLTSWNWASWIHLMWAETDRSQGIWFIVQLLIIKPFFCFFFLFVPKMQGCMLLFRTSSIDAITDVLFFHMTFHMHI